MLRGHKDIVTTTTPFDMVVRNDLDSCRLVMDVLDRAPGLALWTAPVRQLMEGTDLPEIADWSWDG
ncbi:hypothetical protein AQI96_07330 [Streptomyces canus]|nr:hypothetical protein AQI96_07330 [Streptomyces canus]